jgi:hypothetical protein
MKNWMFAALALVLLAFNGCSKYTTPKKVERKIVDGSWTMTNFTLDGESIIDNYTGYTFGFGEGGGVIVKGPSFTSNGSWEMGLNKNPAILYLSFLPEGGLEFLADDWQVVEMRKNLMKLKRNGDTGSTANVTFKK